MHPAPLTYRDRQTERNRGGREDREKRRGGGGGGWTGGGGDSGGGGGIRERHRECVGGGAEMRERGERVGWGEGGEKGWGGGWRERRETDRGRDRETEHQPNISYATVSLHTCTKTTNRTQKWFSYTVLFMQGHVIFNGSSTQSVCQTKGFDNNKDN